MFRSILAILAVLVATLPGRAMAAEVFTDFRAAADKPRVTVLGTWHWGDTPDTFRAAPVDYRSPERRAQTADLLDRLAAFAPTKVLLEYEPERDDEMNGILAGLKAGNWPERVTERIDVGMALAARLGHPRVWGIDHQLSNWDMGRLMKAAEENGQGAVLKGVLTGVQAELAEKDALLAKGTILDGYRWVNDPRRVAARDAIDLLAARLGSRADPVGLDIQGTWYVRNLHIYVNIMRVLRPGDRALVLVGAAHKPSVERYLAASGQVDLVDVRALLD